MRIFVTGGAGFLGSHLVRHLATRSNDEITVYDALTYAGNRSNLVDLLDGDRVRLVVGDICDRTALVTAMTGHDAVVHAAAETHVDRSLPDPDVFVRTNCLGTSVVCDVAREVGVTRLLHVSTDEVYGPIERGSFAEDDPLRPRSPYAASKAGSDLIALAHAHSHGLSVVVTRSANLYGPRQFPEKLIPLAITSLIRGRPVPVYGDGLQVRDWLHVDDACRALDRVLRHGEPGRIYNVSANEERTNLSVVTALVDHLGGGPGSITHVADRAGHDRRYSIRTERIRSLGWAPSHRFDEALAETVTWYEQHPGWWEPLLDQLHGRSPRAP